MSGIVSILNERKSSFILLFLHSIIFLYVFGKKILHLDSIFFAESYDAARNYFSYYYYVNIQESNNLFFEGLNYPFGDYIFYTDNTPILAVIAKFLNLEYSIGFYNGVFLLSWFLVPILAYQILKLLKVKAWINVAFSLLICWTNPLINHFGSTVNLSMFIFYLIAFLLFLKYLLSNNKKKHLLYSVLQIVTLFIASFFHLYYLPILILFLGGCYFTLFLSRLRFAPLFHFICIAALGGGLVYISIYTVDTYYHIRPRGSGGYDYIVYKNSITDFIKSLTYLNFPNNYKYENWGDQKWSFIGSGYLLSILIFLLSIPAILYKHNRKTFIVLVVLLMAGLLCYSVSLGHIIELKNGYEITNYLNPFYWGSKFTDFFTHFRYLRRFSAPFWMAIFVSLAIVSSLLWNLKTWYAHIARIVIILFLSVSVFDAYEYCQFHHKNYERTNLFTEKNLKIIPDFKDYNFQAILPLPFFHVGTDNNKYTIDDPDIWSKLMYQLSVKNKLPIIACKLGRTPYSFAEKTFSLFDKKTDNDLSQKLANKKILLAVSEIIKWNNENNSTTMELKSKLKLFFKKHRIKKLFTKENITYYEAYLN